MVSGSHHFLSINSGHTSDSLARTHQGPWGVLRFLAALRSLQHTSLPDEPCHCDQSGACRVYVGFSDSAWRPERMPQNHSKSRRKDEKKNEIWGYCLSYSLTNLDAEMLSRYMWVSKTASKLLSFPPNRPVRRCGEIHCQIHSYFAAHMDILTSWILHILYFAWEAPGTTWPLASMYSLFLDTTPALKLDFGHKGAKDANRNQRKKLEEPLVFPWVPIKLMDCAQQLGLSATDTSFFISGELDWWDWTTRSFIFLDKWIGLDSIGFLFFFDKIGGFEEPPWIRQGQSCQILRWVLRPSGTWCPYRSWKRLRKVERSATWAEALLYHLM